MRNFLNKKTREKYSPVFCLSCFLLRCSFNKFVDFQWAAWALDGFKGGRRTRLAVGITFCYRPAAISSASAIIGGSASKVSNGGGFFKSAVSGDSAKSVSVSISFGAVINTVRLSFGARNPN